MGTVRPFDGQRTGVVVVEETGSVVVSIMIVRGQLPYQRHRMVGQTDHGQLAGQGNGRSIGVTVHGGEFIEKRGGRRWLLLPHRLQELGGLDKHGQLVERWTREIVLGLGRFKGIRHLLLLLLRFFCVSFNGTDVAKPRAERLMYCYKQEEQAILLCVWIREVAF